MSYFQTFTITCLFLVLFCSFVYSESVVCQGETCESYAQVPICGEKYPNVPEEKFSYWIELMRAHRQNISRIYETAILLQEAPDAVLDCNLKPARSGEPVPPNDMSKLKDVDVWWMKNETVRTKAGFCAKFYTELDVKNFHAPKLFFCDPEAHNMTIRGVSYQDTTHFPPHFDVLGNVINRTEVVLKKIDINSDWIEYKTFESHLLVMPQVFTYREGFGNVRVFDHAHSIYVSAMYLSAGSKTTRNDLSGVRVIKHERAFLLTTKVTMALTYYHNLVDEMFGHLFHNLYVLLKYPDMVIYTPNNPRDNGALVGWLTAFGIDPDRLVLVDRSNSTVYYADMLYVPYPSRTKFPSPATLQAARKVIFEKLQLNHHLPEGEGIVLVQNRVYRGAAPPTAGVRQSLVARSLTNHKEMMETLRATFPDETFVEFDGRMNVTETAKLFNRAKVILGPHGAGMANMIYSPQETMMVEINTVTPCVSSMAALSSLLGIGYFGMVVPESTHQAPFTPDISEIVNNVRLALRAYAELK